MSLLKTEVSESRASVLLLLLTPHLLQKVGRGWTSKALGKNLELPHAGIGSFQTHPDILENSPTEIGTELR